MIFMISTIKKLKTLLSRAKIKNKINLLVQYHRLVKDQLQLDPMKKETM